MQAPFALPSAAPALGHVSPFPEKNATFLSAGLCSSDLPQASLSGSKLTQSDTTHSLIRLLSPMQHAVLSSPDHYTRSCWITGIVPDSSSTFLEVGPTLIVCLGLVKIDGFLVLVDLVKPKFGFFALVSQNIYIVNGRFVQLTVIRSVAR